MSVSELAKEITVALINRVNIPTKAGDPQYQSKWAGEAYTIIFTAVFDALKSK